MPKGEHRLKREVGWYGSFSMGYADVGADIYIALGLVSLYAWGGSPVAFLIAATAYIMTGLAYAELASTYPYAGGAQVYTMKATNDLFGFLAGWVIMLDYIVDIALFSMASAGYLSFLIGGIKNYKLGIGFVDLSGMTLVSIILIVFLILINLVGIKESSRFNESMVTPSLIVQLLILSLGLALAFDTKLFISQVRELGAPAARHISYVPFLGLRTQNFLYGLTLAMSSFIGIESIAQAAEETRRPHKWIPLASKLSVIVVLSFTLGFSILSLGAIPLEEFTIDISNPLAVLSRQIPYVGRYIAFLVAVTGFLVTLASANTGVIGVSRVVFSMGKFRLLPSWFYHVHPKTRTPVRTILIFGLMGAALTLLESLERIADLYNFGALLSYVFVHYSLIVLRNKDSKAYRPWKTPFSIKLLSMELPLVGLIGLLSCISIWALVILFHPMGRFLGVIWLSAGVMVYTFYRLSSGYKIFSKDGGRMIKPGMIRYETLVFVKLPVKKELIVKTVSERLKRNFNLHLVSIIDPSRYSPGRLEEIVKVTDLELGELSSSLVKRGFKSSHKVIVGDKIQSALQEAENPFYDFIVIFRGRIGRKGRFYLTETLMDKVKGKIIILGIGGAV